MDAHPFAPLADLLAVDHTVVTTDPRGINRSSVGDREKDSTPQQRAEDLSALIAQLDAGPAAVLGSSGGAVSVLALVQAHPEQVHVGIAHEPPLNELLPDREALWSQTEEMIATYLAGDRRVAWQQFLKMANIFMPDQMFEAMFGGDPGPQARADEHFQFARMLRETTRFRPDFAALRSASNQVIVGIGEESGGQLCDRTSQALAEEIGIEPTLFPGGHIGFAEDPAGFNARLREVVRS
ncbi:hydrolase [Rhizocola hellebori]|uniref:Hydrolase n=2 Tax=Rhizocola hellebori TaxID=1392758 RepID=A0A8J3QE08_9ACTN|nr:hydrolase [Rhizocola hellebori]